MVDSPAIIEQLLAIGCALSGSHSLEELLHLILTSSRDITCSDAGSIYLVDRSTTPAELIFKASQTSSLSHVSFQEARLPLTLNSLAGYVANTGQSLNIPDAYGLSADTAYQLDRHFDQDFNYRTVSVLVLPMQNQAGETIGVLQLINRKQQADQIITPANALTITQTYSAEEQQIIAALASQAAILIDRYQLQASIEYLFAGFVRAAVQVIEARDPATAGHSERVANLTVRLAEEAHATSQGSLRSVLFSDQQLQEIRYAALLHDFGKVGVVESVLHKEKKLYPAQLQSIRDRMLLMQRQWQLDCVHQKYQQLLTGSLIHQLQADCPHCQQIQLLDQSLQIKLDRLAQHWDLISQLNEPQVLRRRDFVESIEDMMRDLQELAACSYQDLDGHWQPVITATEIEQLLIPKGSLTDTERDQVQAHVVHTYDFLKQIPWTKHLQDVPKIARSHHEKLDGTGYPQGLTAAEIPIQSQMMAIADIYDALTASDRPYKNRLSIEQSLAILQQEATQQKINADLLLLFQQRQVYQVVGHKLNI
jgi:HD-GYP domain-containing protein (c-di-GMP phosphodiesterase class II)